MANIQVKVKKIRSNATLPTFGSAFAAGADLRACIPEEIVINPKETSFVGTGLSMEIPDGYAGLIYARSGLACKQGAAPANKVGVVDSDYRGEVMVALHNHSNNPITIAPGDRIAQMIIQEIPKCEYVEVSELDDTVRGEGGFGSTGKN